MHGWLSLTVVAGAVGLSLGVGAQELRVAITAQRPYLDVQHEGKLVRIQRIQDTNHRLIDSWSRTSRPCPPACIQPMQIAPGVLSVGELELLDFLDQQVRNGRGVLLDNRLPEFFRLETIPSAINLPFGVLQRDNPQVAKVLEALGARRQGDQWNFQQAKELLMFCSAVWSDDSARAVRALLTLGFPADKLKYYRGGLQAWRLQGLTTVVPAH
jgi:rhodanese-related sulfurtransferase